MNNYQHNGNTIRLLIIDDNPDDIELYQRLLQKNCSVNFTFFSTHSGSSGIKLLNNENIDCVLLDYSLPEYNGMNILNHIKQIQPRIPVIALTGQGSDSLAAEFIKSGAFDYINKSKITEISLWQAITNSLANQSNLSQSLKDTKELINLMIVDDNPDDTEKWVRDLKRLENTNYTFIELSSGNAMLEYLKAHHRLPDCVLLDYSLPGRNGLELLQDIVIRYPHLPIIILTGQGNERVAVQAIKQGAQDYLVKGEINALGLDQAILKSIKSLRLERAIAEKELALQNSKMLNDLIMRCSKHLIISFQPSGIITSFNPAAESTLGYPAKEVIGKEIPVLWYDNKQIMDRAEKLSAELSEPIFPGLDTIIAKCQKFGTSTEEWIFKRKDGSSFIGHQVLSCMLNAAGTIIGYLCFIEDITTSKQAEAELTDAYALQDLILRHNPDYLFVKDHYFRLVLANPAFLSLYPQDQRDHVIGSTTLESYTPEDAEKFLEKDKEAFAKGYSESYETINFPDGEIRTLFTKKVLFKNANNAPFILGIGRDVSAQQKLISQLEHSNNELDQFAYIASHDLREPLRGLRTYSDFLQKEANLSLNENCLKYISRIVELSQRAEKFLDALLYYSRLGREEESYSTVNSQTVCNDCLETYITPENLNNCEITYQVEMPTLHCAPILLSRIFGNIISNAIRYCDKPLAKIFVRHKKIGNMRHQFWVEDNGIGIESDHFQRIFNLFKRLHSREAYGQGVGIGLTIAKKAASLHGGDISVESSTPGKGSIFTFTIMEREC